MRNIHIAWLIIIFVVLIIVAGGMFYIYQPLQTPTATNTDIQKDVEPYHPTEFETKFNNNDLDAAIAVAQLNASSSTNTTTLLALATAYSQKGTIDQMEKEYGQKAIDTARKVLVYDPKNSEAYRIIGYGYEIMTKYKEAEQAYTAAIIYNQKSDIAFASRGHMYDLMGDSEKAYSDYRDAYLINPNNALLQLNIARYFFSIGDLDSALTYATSAAAISPQVRLRASAFDLIGGIYLNQNKHAEAIDSYSKAISIDPKFSDAYVDRAFAVLSTAADQDSVSKSVNDDAQKAIELNPTKSFAYLVKGLALFKTNKVEAKATLTKGLSVVDSDLTLTATDKVEMKIQIKNQLTALNS